MANHVYSTLGVASRPIALVDLDSHPDGELLRLCSQVGCLQDQYFTESHDVDHCPRPHYPPCLHRLIWQISDTPARTPEGFRLKALCLLGEDDGLLNGKLERAALVGVIKEAVRLGIQS